MEIAKLNSSHVGAPVIYTPEHGPQEKGVITSWNEKFVFVCYDETGRGKATPADRLRFANCYNCAYKGSVPGSAHIRCNFKWTDAIDDLPGCSSQHAFNQGWWIFPLNYDPVWMDGHCKRHSLEKDPEMTSENNPFLDLLSLLGKRGLGL